MIQAQGLLLIKNDVIIHRPINWDELVAVLDISITDKGWVIFEGEKMNPQYTMKSVDDINGWLPHDAMKDWVKCYFRKQTNYELLKWGY